jgi:hypothetical protein
VLLLDGVDTSVLLEKILHKLGHFLVLQLGLVKPGLLEEILQLRVIVQIESCLRIPADVTDVLEVARCSDIRRRQRLLGFALVLLAFVLSGGLAHCSRAACVVRRRRQICRRHRQLW